MPTYEQEIIREAQRLASLRLRSRKLKKELKTINAEMRHATRTMKKLIGAMQDKDWHESGAKSKIVPDGGH